MVVFTYTVGKEQAEQTGSIVFRADVVATVRVPCPLTDGRDGVSRDAVWWLIRKT
jgi:hypothetical protein